MDVGIAADEIEVPGRDPWGPSRTCSSWMSLKTTMLSVNITAESPAGLVSVGGGSSSPRTANSREAEEEL